MAYWSKLHPKIQELPCKAIAHPWTDSCFLAALHIWADCCIGSAKFFGLLYLCQYISTIIKGKKKANVKDSLNHFVRSTCFGATVTSSSLMIHCLLRNTLGKFYFPTFVLIPCFIGGYGIFVETRKIRELFTNTFSNCCLEFCLKELENFKILKWNANSQTAAFMALSSFLSSVLSYTNYHSNYFWFFLPPKVNNKTCEKNQVCFHNGNCLKQIFKLFLIYSSTGIVFQLMKQMMVNFNNPKLILLSLMSPKTYKLGFFLGSYVLMYQAIRCFFYRKERKYSLYHDSLAGFLAGATFRFQPTLPIFNSAIITTVQIFTEAAHRKKILPNFPYVETVFALCSALLFHARLLSDSCPRMTTYFMSGVTNGTTDRIHDIYASYLNKFKEIKTN